MEHITIIETDSHGGGYICYRDTVEPYYYDDGGLGNVGSTLYELMVRGVIDESKVHFYGIENAIRALHREVSKED